MSSRLKRQRVFLRKLLERKYRYEANVDAIQHNKSNSKLLIKEKHISADTRNRCKHGQKVRIMTKNTNEFKYSFFPPTIS